MPKINVTEAILSASILNEVSIPGEINFNQTALYHIFYKKYDPKFDPKKQFHLLKAENKITKGRVYLLQLRTQEKRQIIDLAHFARPDNPPEKLIIDGDIPDYCILKLPKYCSSQIEGNVGEGVQIFYGENPVTVLGNVGKNCLEKGSNRFIILGTDLRETKTATDTAIKLPLLKKPLNISSPSPISKPLLVPPIRTPSTVSAPKTSIMTPIGVSTPKPPLVCLSAPSFLVKPPLLAQNPIAIVNKKRGLASPQTPLIKIPKTTASQLLRTKTKPLTTPIVMQDFTKILENDSQRLLEYVETTEKEIQEKKNSGSLQTKNIPLPHQLKTLKQIAQAWRAGKKTAVFELATGTGKTNIMIYLQDAISKTLPNKEKPKMLFIVPLLGLIDQTIERFKAVTGDRLRVSSLKNGNQPLKKNRIKKLFDTSDVVVCTIQSFCTVRGQTYIPFDRISTIVIDEAHTALSLKRSQYLQNKIKIHNLRVIAVTATPYMELGGERTVYELMGFKKDGSDNPVTPYGIQEAIQDGINAPVVSALVYPKGYKKIKIKRNNTKNGDFNQKELDRIVNQKPYNQMVVNLYLNSYDEKTKQPLLGKKAIIFCGGINHAVSIATEFNAISLERFDADGQLRKNYDQKAFEHFIKDQKILNPEAYLETWPQIKEVKYGAFTIAADIHSKKTSEECKKILLRSKLGGCIILTGANKLIEGYDDPEIEVAIRAVPTLSSKVLLQSIGRVLRTSSTLTHKIAYVLEIAWGNSINCKYFNEFLRDRSTYIPRYSLGAVEEHRKFHSKAFNFDEFIAMPEAHPIEDIQWEPKLIENKSIQSCLAFIGPALRQLRDKLDLIKGVKTSLLGNQLSLWTLDPPKPELNASSTLVAEKNRKTKTKENPFLNESDEASFSTDEGENKENADNPNCRPLKKHSSEKKSEAEKFDNLPKKKISLVKQALRKPSSESELVPKNEDDYTPEFESASNYTDRIIGDNLDKAKEVLNYMHKTLSHKNKRVVEKKVSEDNNHFKAQREEALKSIEERLESLLKEYQSLNEKLDTLIKADGNLNNEEELFRQNTLSNLLNRIEEIEKQFETIQKELSILKDSDLKSKTKVGVKKLKHKENSSPNLEKNNLVLAAKNWIKGHPDLSLLELFTGEEIPTFPRGRYFAMLITELIMLGNKTIFPCDENFNTILHLAKNTFEIKALVEKGKMNINVVNKFGDTILHQHANNSDNYLNLDIFSYLLTAPGIDINARNKNGNTPLHLAIEFGLKKNPCQIPTSALFLLAFGASRTIENNSGTTAESLLLNNACRILSCSNGICSGHTIQDLIPTFALDETQITSNTLINIQDNNGYNCLYHAMRSRSLLMIKELINAGINPETLLGPDKKQAVLYLFETSNFICYRSISILKFLTQKNVEINLIDEFGNSPLSMMLTKINNFVMIDRIHEFLQITSPKILRAKNGHGDTPLHIFMQNAWKTISSELRTMKQNEMLLIFIKKFPGCFDVTNNDLDTPCHILYKRLLCYINTCPEYQSHNLKRQIACYTEFNKFLKINNIVLPTFIFNNAGESIAAIQQKISDALEKLSNPTNVPRVYVDAKEVEEDYARASSLFTPSYLTAPSFSIYEEVTNESFLSETLEYEEDNEDNDCPSWLRGGALYFE